MVGSRLSAAAAALLLGAAGAQAQDHRMAFTAYVGSASYSDMATDAVVPVLLAPGTLTGGQAEVWFQRFGFRVNGGYAGTALSGEPGTGVGVLVADVDLVARLRWPRRGLFFQPFAVLGGGVVRYDLGTDATTLGGQQLASDPTTRGSVVLGIGTDLGSGPVAARVELMDIIGTSSPLTRADGTRHSAVQHVVLTFGLTFRAGRVALLPRPSPTPRAPGARPTSRPPVQRPGRPAPDPGPSSPSPRPPAIDTIDLTAVPARPVPGPTEDPGSPGGGEPVDSTVHGRLFTVRVSWEPDDEGAAKAAEAAAVLRAAGVPVWPQGSPDDAPARSDVGALRNAAAARALGEHLLVTYGLAARWVHIDRDAVVSATDVAASHAFVEGLGQDGRPSGRAVGRDTRPRGGGGPPR